MGDIDIEGKFVDCLRKNFLIQHINTPTRVKGTDTPHVLDLVITDEYFIQNLIFESPLGKSDHSVITFDYNLIPGINNNTNRNAKGNYESLRGSLQLPWNDILSPHSDELYNKINLFVPQVKSSVAWKKKLWTRPLDLQLRKK